MRRIAVILVGIGLILLGGIWIFKDIYGENIAGTAEDIAVNMVAVKINESREFDTCAAKIEVL